MSPINYKYKNNKFNVLSARSAVTILVDLKTKGQYC